MNGSHEARPDTDTVTREDGSPVSLLDLKSYAAIAACRTCGKKIRDADYPRYGWYHVEPEAGTEGVTVSDDPGGAMLETMDDDKLVDHARAVFRKLDDTPRWHGDRAGLLVAWGCVCSQLNSRGLDTEFIMTKPAQDVSAGE